MITHEDIEGFMETVYELEGRQLDLILHSSGGQPEAAEAIVQYLRKKFDDIRVLVPHQAMSAATMLACAANHIVMARHSILGPIDPQLFIQNKSGATAAPAQAILDQFDRAKRECAQDQKALPVWMPILQQYGPALLEQCENFMALSQKIVANWLERYMFEGETDGEDKARKAAAFLADHRERLTHGRPLDIDTLRDIGLHVVELEKDQDLQNHLLTVYHATMHTFSATPATKIIENHLGRALVKQVRVEISVSQTSPPSKQQKFPTTPKKKRK